MKNFIVAFILSTLFFSAVSYSAMSNEEKEKQEILKRNIAYFENRIKENKIKEAKAKKELNEEGESRTIIIIEKEKESELSEGYKTIKSVIETCIDTAVTVAVVAGTVAILFGISRYIHDRKNENPATFVKIFARRNQGKNNALDFLDNNFLAKDAYFAFGDGYFDLKKVPPLFSLFKFGYAHGGPFVENCLVACGR